MQENSLNNNDDDNIPLTKTKKSDKPNLKKVRSDKQIAAFNKTMEIRKQKVEERKQQKLLESAKILVEKHSTIKSNKVAPVVHYEASSEDQSTASENESSSEEEEIIVVKNKSKIKEKHTKEKHKKEKHKKKPSKKTIIFDSSSESSSDSSGGSEEYIKAPKRTTERVKRKEVVVEQPPIKTLNKPEDFRVYFI